jgi:hypothetical protein
MKRDVIFRRMQLNEPLRQEVPRIRIQAQQCQGIVKNNAPLAFLHALNDTLTSNVP